MSISFLLCLLFLFFACDEDPSYQKRAEITEDFQTEYYVGDAFVPSGKLWCYSDYDCYSSVPITVDMVSGFDTSTPRSLIVTVAFEEYSATAAITVRALTVTSISIDRETLPDSIYKGHGFPSGVTLTAVLSNGTKESGIPVTESMLTNLYLNKAGTQTVSVRYREATTAFLLTIKEDRAESLSLLNVREEPYAVNASGLDLEDTLLIIHYESGDTKREPLKAEWVTGFSTARGGTNLEATVTYLNLQCKLTYSVQRQPRSLSLKEGTLPSILERGDPFPEGGKGILLYDDDTTEEVPLTAENAPTFRSNEVGVCRVAITAFDLPPFYYEYEVLPIIESAVVFGTTQAVEQGRPFDGFGELNVFYEVEGQESIPLTDPRITLTYDTLQTGTVTQTARFRNRDFSFSVRVYPAEEKYAINHLEMERGFSPILSKEDISAADIDTTGVRINVVYEYLSPTLVECRQEFISVTGEAEGDILPLRITYGGASVDSFVKVLLPDYATSVTSLVAENFRTLYVVGESLSVEDATLVAIYGGGYDSVYGIVVEKEFISNFDTSTAGVKEMTVTYQGFSIRVSYRVITEAERTQVTNLSIESFFPLLFVGDEVGDIDKSDYILAVTYGYGYAVENVSLADVVLTGGPFTRAGSDAVTVIYGGVERAFPVTVYVTEDQTRVTSIRVLAKMIYATVGFPPDFSQIELEVTYGYGYRTEKIPLSSPDVTHSDYVMNQVGLQSITFEYAHVRCDTYLSYVPGESGNVLESISLESTRREFSVGDTLEGVNILAVYSAERRVSVPVTREMAPEFSTETEGEHRIMIVYGGKTAEYIYTVTAR